MISKPMTLILIEDSIEECNAFKKYAKSRKDIYFVGITDSDIEALEILKEYKPEGIILDLELNKGRGNTTGFNFLNNVKKMNLKTMPKIIVTTNVYSESVYDYLHENGVDLVLYKKQVNYSVQNVINTLLVLRNIGTNVIKEPNNIELLEERNDIISKKINKELDLIGVGTHLQGRKYLYDAIYYILQEDEEKNSRITVIQYLVKKYKRSNSTISRAMQNAILHAWRISSIEDLTLQYTAKINYETGIPTPTEFIYYYADKIKKSI